MIAHCGFGLVYLMLARVLSWLALLTSSGQPRTSRSSCCVTRSPRCADTLRPRLSWDDRPLLRALSLYG